MSHKLAQALLKDRIIAEKQFQDADQAVGPKGNVIHYLIEKGQVSETKLLAYLSQKFGLPTINLSKFEVQEDVLRLVSTELARKLQVIPIQKSPGTIVVAVADPTVLDGLEELRFRLKVNVEAVLTTFSAFQKTFEEHFGGAAFVGEAIESFQKESQRNRDAGGVEESAGLEMVQVHDMDSNATAEDAPVIALVNGVLGEAIRKGASDIHVEPYEKRFRIRLRVDGVLLEVVDVPVEMKRAVVARFKIMSRMDISEARIPQDGRIKLKARGKETDFRVNTLPTLFGEKVVLRILSQANLQLDMMKLGFETRQLEVFKKAIYSPNGLVLVTGPTGSGKTTTLYSALSELNGIQDNISTVEDPVEYNLEGVNQVQINREVGLTFASALRSLLRQDPDTILVGEIRDYETGEIAIQAALTGHLVLSTLHTNDAPSTITRLVNMGIEPFLVVASLNAIVAQRLLRMLCPKCKVPASIPAERLTALGFSPEAASRLKTFAPKGCSHCNQGYKGRVAIYEIFDFTPNLKEMVLRGSTTIEIKRQAIKEGMKTLRMSALTKAAEGLTSMEEAVSNTMES
jgi:type IV pilus assembly protein PilB